MAIVELNWYWISWNTEQTWSETEQKLLEADVNINELSRSIYIIRLNGNFCVNYSTGKSPCVYIGEGNFKERLTSHKGRWLPDLGELSDSEFLIYIAVPRVKNAIDTYRDCEAATIERFKEKFGCLPLWNKQNEKRIYSHKYPYEEIDKIIGIGKGVRYLWAVEPMPASPYYAAFNKGND